MYSSRQKAPPYAWAVLLVSLLACLTAPINLQKIPGIATILIPYFGIDFSSIGLLMSVFSIMGLVFALPAGLITERVGIKAVILLSLSMSFIGSCIGALSNDFSLLLISRFIEGIGVGFIFVATPAAIASWFPPDRHGIALGIWGISMPVGTLLILNISSALALAFQWQAVWWFSSIFILVSGILFAIVYKKPPSISTIENKQGQTEDQALKKSEIGVLKNGSLWLAGLIFGLFNFVMIGCLVTFYPSFLETEVGLPMQSASFLTSLITALAIVIAPLTGIVTDSIGKKRVAMLLSSLILTVAMIFVYRVSSFSVALIIVLLLGLFGPIVTTIVRIIIPEITGNDVNKVSFGMVILALFQNAGVLIGPVVFGVTLGSFSWESTGLIICVSGFALMTVASILLYIDERRKKPNV